MCWFEINDIWSNDDDGDNVRVEDVIVTGKQIALWEGEAERIVIEVVVDEVETPLKLFVIVEEGTESPTGVAADALVCDLVITGIL